MVERARARGHCQASGLCNSEQACAWDPATSAACKLRALVDRHMVVVAVSTSAFRQTVRPSRLESHGPGQRPSSGASRVENGECGVTVNCGSRRCRVAFGRRGNRRSRSREYLDRRPPLPRRVYRALLLSTEERTMARLRPSPGL